MEVLTGPYSPLHCCSLRRILTPICVLTACVTVLPHHDVIGMIKESQQHEWCALLGWEGPHMRSLKGITENSLLQFSIAYHTHTVCKRCPIASTNFWYQENVLKAQVGILRSLGIGPIDLLRVDINNDCHRGLHLSFIRERDFDSGGFPFCVGNMVTCPGVRHEFVHVPTPIRGCITGPYHVILCVLFLRLLLSSFRREIRYSQQQYV